MAADPLVTVVIPTYNRAHVIGRTIADVFNQTYKNLQLVIVDDGSTDNTTEVLTKFDGRVEVVRQANGGAASARNRGIREARGEIIAFQDSDDEWHPTKIERQVRLLSKLGRTVPCCLCNAVFRAEAPNGAERLTFDIGMLHSPYEEGLWLNPAEVLASRCIFFNQVVAVRREALERIGGFNAGLRYLEEWDLALKLASLGPWGFIREPLTYWNPGNNESITKRAVSEGAWGQVSAIQVLSDALELPLMKNSPAVRKQLLRRLRAQSREHRAWGIRERNHFGASAISRFLLFIERCRFAANRRIGQLPTMVTQPLR
jgi:glycosyltransferase involved in cell wall biosynthesis